MQLPRLHNFHSKRSAIAVIGLGYVGLPLALELARKFKVIGFDINDERIQMMRQGKDPSKELASDEFEGCDIYFTSQLKDIAEAQFYIVAVPTPIDNHQMPDLKPLLGASATVGKVLKQGDTVVFESTVYPGCTEEDCVPILEKESGLRFIKDFKVGYSPERINPGDKQHTLTKILKVVSGCDAESSELIAGIYSSVIEAGVFKASSIRVAEAAKVIENTQRDLNIALMNELSMIFDRMGINTFEVLEAAGTKWNFLKFFPGLVGGHCIGVDPYYLTFKSKALGHNPRVILSGRNINDGMGAWVALRTVQQLIKQGKNVSQCRVLVLGATFKENVADIRNSKVADLVQELNNFSIHTEVMDPYADSDEVLHEYGFSLIDKPAGVYDAIILAVAHNPYKEAPISYIESLATSPGLLVDLKGVFRDIPTRLQYWSL